MDNRKKDLLYTVKNELSIENESSILPQSDLNNLEIENLPTIEEQTEKIERSKKKESLLVL